jgi:hypothetical protein
MPIEENPCYDRPYMGQPFKLVQNEHRIEYGCITGFTVTSVNKDPETGAVTETWTACVSSTVSNASFRFYHNTHRGDWIPLTAAEIAEQRGAAVLGDVVDKATFLALAERCAVLVADAATERDEYLRLQGRVDETEARYQTFEEKLAELQARVAAGAPIPSDGPKAPPAPPNGRPSRVASSPPTPG